MARPSSTTRRRGLRTLDGRRITPDFRFGEAPETGIRGIVAYIPVAGLARGEHVLAVAALPLIDPTPAEARNPTAVHHPLLAVTYGETDHHTKGTEEAEGTSPAPAVRISAGRSRGDGRLNSPGAGW
jgi:hypothetical protein